MQTQTSVASRRSLSARARGRLFGLPAEESTFERRGFRSWDEGARLQLEQAGATFLRGYQAALEADDAAALSLRLSREPRDAAGFSFEGAAMALALLDLLTPWSRCRWHVFRERFGVAHVYMLHVGFGWALARLRRRVASPPTHLDPLLGWLALDGYGFHEGYFHWRRFIERCEEHPRVSGYARRAFDQGLGRSIWFVKGAHVPAVAGAVAAFPRARRADLWSGVGLASSYAGGVGRGALEALRDAAGEYRPQLAQGAAFAAKTRLRAGNANAHLEAACEVFCGRTAAAAAAVTDAALGGLQDEAPLPSYEVWRRRIQAEFRGGMSPYEIEHGSA